MTSINQAIRDNIATAEKLLKLPNFRVRLMAREAALRALREAQRLGLGAEEQRALRIYRAAQEVVA
jgi:hypothetical protein